MGLALLPLSRSWNPNPELRESRSTNFHNRPKPEWGEAVPLTITDEIIDAIIQNQGCHVDRPEGKQRFLPWRPRIHFTVLKTDSVTLPAGTNLREPGPIDRPEDG